MKRSRLPSFLILLSWLFYSSCRSPREPELWGIEDLRIDRLGMKESAITLDLHYFNPNNYRLKLKRAEGTVWMDGNSLGHFTLDTLIHIPANGEFRLPVKLMLDMKNFVSNMRVAFDGNQVQLKVEGMARAGKSIFYINYPILFEGKLSLEQIIK